MADKVALFPQSFEMLFECVAARMAATWRSARKRGRITMGEMIRATGASRNTLKEHFKRLGEQGYLVRHGTGKATWYALP